MKLIYAQETCSLGTHIMLEELGIPYFGIKVSLKDKTVLKSYNPKGYVPALLLNDGTLLTESISLLIYLSEGHGQAFMPKSEIERTKCIEWLCFLSTELHKGVNPLFHKEEIDSSYYIGTLDKLHEQLALIEKQLSDNAFLLGDIYTVADMYALGLLRMLTSLGFIFDEYPGIRNYKKELEESPVIKRVIEREKEQRISTETREVNEKPVGVQEQRTF